MAVEAELAVQMVPAMELALTVAIPDTLGMEHSAQRLEKCPQGPTVISMVLGAGEIGTTFARQEPIRPIQIQSADVLLVGRNT
jgi:hypothetical protein